jgi:hypothetical protein
MASPVGAIELFTNFNNGTELGTRPYGIPEMPPVRYHWWQRNYCPPPEMQAPPTIRGTILQPAAPPSQDGHAASDGPKLRNPLRAASQRRSQSGSASARPALVEPQSSSDGGTNGSEEERLDRGANFLPADSRN